jgi:hypothetical protein
MRTRILATLMLALAMLPSCQAIKRTFGLGDGSATTTVYGHWVLATPVDSTAFVGATQVELVLSPGTFNVSATYPNRAPLAIDGRAELANGGLLTLTPSPGNSDVARIGFAPGQPFMRVATASGSTLVLAPPNARVPLPSSVWHRLDAARAAGLVR